LRSFPWQSREGRTFLPLDLLQKHGLTPADVFARGNEGALRDVLAEIRALARENLTLARVAVARATPLERLAYRPAALTQLYLREMERGGYDPWESLIDSPQWRRQWALFRGKI
jgi:phytoene synthase